MTHDDVATNGCPHLLWLERGGCRLKKKKKGTAVCRVKRKTVEYAKKKKRGYVEGMLVSHRTAKVPIATFFTLISDFLIIFFFALHSFHVL